MPEISRFYGIIIKMFLHDREHNPPHFHAVYGEYTGNFNIETLEMYVGDLPKTAQNFIVEWARKHKKALLDIWESKTLTKLPPLR